jgi:hypothetical protein
MPQLLYPESRQGLALHDSGFCFFWAELGGLAAAQWLELSA